MRRRISLPRVFLACFILAISSWKVIRANSHSSSPSSDFDPTESIFRDTVSVFRSSSYRHRWMHWTNLHDLLLGSYMTEFPLQTVGCYEESILFIERYIQQFDQQHTDPTRDKALSLLYYGYAKMLYEHLDPEQCLELARSPHTLLIGAETVRPDTQPSTHLCVENAENHLRNAISLDATNLAADQLLAKLLGLDDNAQGVAHQRKPKEFVAELFDSFADHFDDKLANLEYKVPALVGQAVKGFLESQFTVGFETALDAGCGTGLAGPYLRPLVRGPMIGVDASRKMLDLAAKCTTARGCGVDESKTKDPSEKELPLYDGLLDLDLEDMTLHNTLMSPDITRFDPQTHNSNAFDLVVAADVLVYFGSLDNIMKVFANVSSVGAGLVFSCELAFETEAPLGWRLLPSGRFAHTLQHALQAAVNAGYDMVAYEEIVPRMEKGEPVRGHLFTFWLAQKEQKQNHNNAANSWSSSEEL